jgi:Anaphase promoting complex subunit 8 / Cdc23
LLISTKWAAETCFTSNQDDLPPQPPPIHSKEYYYAKSLFDCKEYLKASFILKDANHDDYLCRFLFYYSKFLAIKENTAFRDETMVEELDLQLIDLKQEMDGFWSINA